MTSHRHAHKHTHRPPALILVAGHWLGGWAWQQVVDHLTNAGLQGVALTLPGLDAADPARATRTLAEQADSIAEVAAHLAAENIENTENTENAASAKPILVAHSGANGPASIALDRRPDLFGRVVWVDSGPVSPGGVFDPTFPDSAEQLALPAFDVLSTRASLAGLSAADLERFRRHAVPEPGPVIRGVVELHNPARRHVPSTLVCCSISGRQLMAMAHAGHPMFAEVTTLTDLTIVDLPTGHWPMWSRPRDLARLLIDAAVPTPAPSSTASTPPPGL